MTRACALSTAYMTPRRIALKLPVPVESRTFTAMSRTLGAMAAVTKLFAETMPPTNVPWK